MPLWELSIEVEPARADALGAALFDAGAGGFEQRDRAGRTELVVWAEAAEQLEQLTAVARSFGAPAKVSERDDRWRREWLEHLRPERVSPGFVVQPVGDETPAPSGAKAIVIAREPAFGVGSHPTTQLAAEAVERLCRVRPGLELLDVGAGTGLLAIIGVLSGARRALGIDVDPVAVEAARKNAELNGVSDRCSFSTTPLAELDGLFDLVVANLETPVLLELGPALVEKLAPNARLVVTGAMLDREGELLARFGLPLLEEQRDGDWCLLELGS